MASNFSCDEDEQTADTLDWSVSCINHQNKPQSGAISIASSISDLQDENAANNTSEIAAMEKLLRTMQSLAAGSNKMIEDEPELSFQCLAAEETEEEIQPSTPQKSQIQESINSTPPVRDPGLHLENSLQRTPINNSIEDPSVRASASKLSNMRNLLRDLESAAKKNNSKTSASKIPRKLSLNKSQNSTMVDNSENLNKKLEDLNRELSEEKSKVERLEAKIKDEMHKNGENDGLVTELRSKVLELEGNLTSALDEKEQKDLMLREMGLRMKQTVQNWNDEQERRILEMKKLQEINSKTNRELNEAKQQVLGVEGELEKALSLAAEFRLKFEESAQFSQNQAENLQKQVQVWQEKAETAEKKAAQSQKAKEEFEQVLLAERTRLKSEMSKMEEKQLVLSRQLSAEQERQKSSEGRLRSFYQRQMESILAKKVEQLQNHVSEMEQGLIKEREEALQGLKWQNEKQSQESWAKTKALLNEAAQRQTSLEASLEAARNEADCLRQQLALAQKRQSSSNWWTSEVESVSSSINSLSNAASIVLKPSENESKIKKKNNNKSNNLLTSTFQERPEYKRTRSRDSGAKSLPLVIKKGSSSALMNNRQPAKNERPKSANANLSLQQEESLLNNEEKEKIAKDCLSDFLSDNPDFAAVSDIETLLQPLVTKMLQRSVRPEDKA